MKPFEHFQFCPRCGKPRSEEPTDKMFHCRSCEFVYYFNPAIGAAAFVINPAGDVLFIQRASEPAKGKLALPGGFVDAGETIEYGLAREIREEVNLEVSGFQYLCSGPNEYQYKNVTYSVLDLFFIAKVESGEGARAMDGVASYNWLPPSRVDPQDIAFKSIRDALRRLLSRV